MPVTEDEEVTEDFDEAAWNVKRKGLETLAIAAVLDISEFMGCNQFSFLHNGKRINIKIEL
jgi:hypothetical protein